jgi:hypothetical protein
LLRLGQELEDDDGGRMQTQHIPTESGGAGAVSQ